MGEVLFVTPHLEMKVGWLLRRMDTSLRFTQSQSLSRLTLNAPSCTLQPTRSQMAFKSLHSSVLLALLLTCFSATCLHWTASISKRVLIAQHFHFHKRDQAAGESIADYDASLRKLASQCKFVDSLEEALRDRFVCGLRHKAIQRRLLSETDLSYAKAIEIARAMEVADRDTKPLRAQRP